MRHQCDSPGCTAFFEYEQIGTDGTSKYKTEKALGWKSNGLPGHSLCPECSVKLEIGIKTHRLEKVIAELDDLSAELLAIQLRGIL